MSLSRVFNYPSQSGINYRFDDCPLYSLIQVIYIWAQNRTLRHTIHHFLPGQQRAVDKYSENSLSVFWIHSTVVSPSQCVHQDLVGNLWNGRVDKFFQILTGSGVIWNNPAHIIHCIHSSCLLFVITFIKHFLLFFFFYFQHLHSKGLILRNIIINILHQEREIH